MTLLFSLILVKILVLLFLGLSHEDTELQVGFHKGFLFGASKSVIEYEDETVDYFQVALGFIIITLTYVNEQ